MNAGNDSNWHAPLMVCIKSKIEQRKKSQRKNQEGWTTHQQYDHNKAYYKLANDYGKLRNCDKSWNDVPQQAVALKTIR